MALLEGSGLACHRGGRDVFRDLGFSLDEGQALLVTGPNGSGKSSLLRLLAGLLRPSAGNLLFAGRAIDEDAAAYRRRLCYVGHADALKPVLTVEENLAFWVRGPKAGGATTALEALALSSLRDLPARLLSQGQRRRLALSRLLVADAKLWLLDEPTVGLDAAARRALARVVAEHRAAGGLVVLSAHEAVDLPDAKTLALDDHAVVRAPEMVW